MRPMAPSIVAPDTAVEVSREERHAAGQEVDTTSGWSVEDIGVGLRARLHALGEAVAQLQLAAGEERLDAWRASGARLGAFMALRLANSWYRNLDLGKLVAQHDGSEAELQGVEEALRVRANGIAEYAAWDDFGVKMAV
ncbi:hypothetical protein ZWY2020_054702 [Hordeum vulgare]|nr:hypothetical protein ZWY2020_054702 [Hordeum vulgare]